MFQLADGAKRVDAKRRELLRHSEHQSVRLEALEKELDRQLGLSDDLRRQVKRKLLQCKMQGVRRGHTSHSSTVQYLPGLSPSLQTDSTTDSVAQ